MSWESFNWETLLWVGGIVLLVFFMMRGCGGMMGGGCGMGGRRHRREADRGEGGDHDPPEKKA